MKLVLGIYLCLAVSIGASAQMSYHFSLLAGSVKGGYVDGDLASSKFRSPEGIALDHLGNIYVTEYGNNIVRKISADGQVSTLAGVQGQIGQLDGDAASALFNRPHGLAVGPDQSVFVCDMHNYAIRKISPEGQVTTYAGKMGEAGSVDGHRLDARFLKPEAIVIDRIGNLYVADTYNCTIRKIDTTGVVTTIAGKAGECSYADGAGLDARFGKTLGLAIDRQFNLYVADANYDGKSIENNLIRKIDLNGQVSTLAGSLGKLGHQDGEARIALLDRPVGVAADDAGQVFVADTEGDVIRVIKDGVVTTVGGRYQEEGFTDGIGSQALFNDPQAIAVDAEGNLYIADTFNNCIRIGRPVD